MIKAPVKLVNVILVLLVRIIIRICATIFFRPKVYYVNKKVQKKRIRKNAVIVSNHTYFIDGVLIGTLFYRDRIYSFIAEDLYTNFLKKWLLKGCRGIPLNRNEVDSTWMHKGVDVLRKGYPICIFPEGVSNYDGVMTEFKPGFILLAIRTNSPIIPICIDGPYDFVLGQRQRIMIGEPVYINVPKGGMSKEFLQQEADKFHDIIQDMQKKLQSKYKKKDKKQS